jgi:hypothetical protein
MTVIQHLRLDVWDGVQAHGAVPRKLEAWVLVGTWHAIQRSKGCLRKFQASRKLTSWTLFLMVFTTVIVSDQGCVSNSAADVCLPAWWLSLFLLFSFCSLLNFLDFICKRFSPECSCFQRHCSIPCCNPGFIKQRSWAYVLYRIKSRLFLIKLDHISSSVLRNACHLTAPVVCEWDSRWTWWLSFHVLGFSLIYDSENRSRLSVRDKDRFIPGPRRPWISSICYLDMG